MPLSTLVINWLNSNPDEYLTKRDVSIKWDVSIEAADGVLRRGAESGKLRRKRAAHRWEPSEFSSVKGTE